MNKFLLWLSGKKSKKLTKQYKYMGSAF